MKKIILKSITWRILIICSSFLIAYILGLEIKKSITLTLTLNLINMILYIFHEKLWNYENKIKSLFKI